MISNSNLKFVVALRHGEYDQTKGDSAPLNEAGVAHTEEMASILVRFLGDKTCTIISSHYPRAIQSAQIIGTKIRTGSQKSSVFNNGSYGAAAKLAEQLVRESNGAQVLIVVCHHKAPSGVIAGFQKLRGDSECLPPYEPTRGDGYVLGLEQGTLYYGLKTLPLPK